MQTVMTKTTLAIVVGIGLLALAMTGCASSGGKPRVRVTEEKGYIQLTHVQDASQPVALKKGDAMAMVCGKCKTVWYQSPASASRPFFYPPPLRQGVAGDAGWQHQRWAFRDWSKRHYCPGCKSTVTTTGTWKDRKETIKHTCESCGDNSVFCCATKADDPPTPGMEFTK
jgi:RNase P subunit RPR2